MSSVANSPGEIMATPEVTISGLFVPSMTSPIASMARASIWPFSTNFEKSWMKARWITPSASFAALFKLSRSVRSPRCTFAPSFVRISAFASLRARPVTSWPLASSSFVVAVPMKPAAPVTNTRMGDSLLV